MFTFRTDPGPCPVDDAPHHGCVGPSPQGGQLAAPLLPARDRRAAVTHPFGDHGPGQVTTATYRRPLLRALRGQR